MIFTSKKQLSPWWTRKIKTNCDWAKRHSWKETLWLINKQHHVILLKLLYADFLTKIVPGTWQNEVFLWVRPLSYIISSPVINERAERAVKLIQDYKGIIATNEEHKQHMLQIVEPQSQNPWSQKSLRVNVKDDIHQ